VFGALTRQALGQVEVIPEPLATEIEYANHNGERLLDPTQAIRFLQQSLEVSSKSMHFYVVFDGLDEATESSQNIICNGLRNILSEPSIPVKLFITGREDLGSLLRVNSTTSFFRIPVSTTIVDLDIASYIRASTKRRIAERLLVVQDPSLEELIVQELVKGAKGMSVCLFPLLVATTCPYR